MMSIERAREIVKAVNARCFVHMGLQEELPSLDGISLGEMLRAATMVKVANETAQAEAKISGGGCTISMVPADRLIAAAFAMEHYPISNEPILALPLRPGRMRALALVDIAAPKPDDDDD